LVTAVASINISGEAILQTPVQIDFKGFEGSEAQRTAINEHLAQLEGMFGGIIAGRIAVKAPEKHHRHGGPFEISIRLKLPDGREVAVSRAPSIDERYSNFNFALGDAFRRAKRQLQEHVERLQGEVKSSTEHPIGTVVRLFEDHGFLETSDGLEVYFHQNSVLNGAFGKLEPGAKVYFTEEQGEKGAQASTVKFLGKHALR
jgi:cold shock CspA family protein